MGGDRTTENRILYFNVTMVRERRDGALALSDLRLLLNQPPRKLGGRYFFFFHLLRCAVPGTHSLPELPQLVTGRQMAELSSSAATKHFVTDSAVICGRAGSGAGVGAGLKIRWF